jgi:protein-S-isoprenylcysteine O-methyltransferase Ste14
MPFTVTVVIPALILWGQDLSARLSPISAIAGGLLIALGLFLMGHTIALFVTIGKGTLAPWDPTQHLVVRGVYRYVRNPMISGVISILLGEALLFWSRGLLSWYAIFVVVNMIYMPLLEEPGLERRFGPEYLLYKQNVPRWIPQLKPWDPPWNNV